MVITVPYSQFFTTAQGEEIRNAVENEVNKNDYCVIDFINVKSYTVNAVGGLFGKLITDFGKEFIDEFLTLRNVPHKMLDYI